MKLLDINEKYELALIAADDLSSIEYAPLREVPLGTTIDNLAFAYLKQAHYVARASSVGLTVQTVEMQPGWKVYDEQAKFYGKFR